MKKFAMSNVVAALFPDTHPQRAPVQSDELKELSAAEIAAVAGGPEGEPAAGVIPPA